MPENKDQYYTELDKNLQNLAAMDWPTFVQLLGPECIMAAKICILRSKGKSYNQIATKLHTTRDAVIYRGGKCECN